MREKPEPAQSQYLTQILNARVDPNVSPTRLFDFPDETGSRYRPLGRWLEVVAAGIRHQITDARPLLFSLPGGIIFAVIPGALLMRTSGTAWL